MKNCQQIAMTKREIGMLGEKAAAEYLENQGYSVICTNYSCRYGEIDIIAADELYILFTEVKTRAKNSFGTPAEAVNRRKQKKLIITATDYIYKHPVAMQPRFDVIEVITPASGDFSSTQINHIQNAFFLEDANGIF